MDALGLTESTDPEVMNKNLTDIRNPTPEGARRRKVLEEAVRNSDLLYNAIGVEMNQRYESSAIVSDGSVDPGFERDPELHIEVSSRPGANVPHAWITKNGHSLSTIDLCGRGRFSILTGICGEGWVDIGKKVSEELGIELAVHVIGLGKTYEDPYGEFSRLRGTSETGALLVRPDFMVGWRTDVINESSHDELLQVLKSILGRVEDSTVDTAPVNEEESTEKMAFKDHWL